MTQYQVNYFSSFIFFLNDIEAFYFLFQLMDSENMGNQSSSGETLCSPNVASDYKSYKGQECDNLEEVFACYNKYAKKVVLALEFILVKEVRTVTKY